MDSNDETATADGTDDTGTTGPTTSAGPDRDGSTNVHPGGGIDYDVPGDAAVRTCPECARPFPDADLLALHRGLDHEASLSDADRDDVERVRSTEERRLRLFRLKALAVLVLLYFGLLMVYAVVT